MPTGTPLPPPLRSQPTVAPVEGISSTQINVRSEPSVYGDIVTKVNPGETYEYSKEENGWYYITLDDGSVGWVSGDYVQVVEN